MRNILLVVKNNLYRLTKEKVLLGVIIITLPVVICIGVYFGQMDSLKGKIAIVAANSQQEESITKSLGSNEKVTLEFLDKNPSKTQLIKGIYLAEINFTKAQPEIISYGKEDIKRELDASIKGEIYKENIVNTTVQGKIIGFLTMFWLLASIMMMDFFLTDRENGVFVRVLSGKLSYYKYIVGQILYAILIFTIPNLIISVMFLEIFSVKLSISIGLFSSLIFLLGLVCSSFSMLVCTISKSKASALSGASGIVMITSLLGGCLIDVVDNNKIIGFIRSCLPQKRLIDLANKYNNEDLIFLIIMILAFVSISVFIGKRQYENGDFIK